MVDGRNSVNAKHVSSMAPIKQKRKHTPKISIQKKSKETLRQQPSKEMKRNTKQNTTHNTHTFHTYGDDMKAQQERKKERNGASETFHDH